MLDIESLVFERFVARFPDYWVSSENDPSISFPAIVYSLSGDGQTGNGPGIWRFTLELSVLVPPDLFSVVQEAYEEVRSWVGSRSDSGHITRVVDESLMSRAGTTTANDKTINQYTGSFAIIARP